ncbi:MAG: hypothetical protein HC908_12595 [Calothrix sp. SM1_7_51]|nr:hypothetical protein [Calothrix sp. SM1_7_51]
MTGNQPIDELALALAEIVSYYEDRFARKPTITELMWAMETVLGSNPNRDIRVFRKCLNIFNHFQV